jgi:hypothetical protein
MELVRLFIGCRGSMPSLSAKNDDNESQSSDDSDGMYHQFEEESSMPPLVEGNYHFDFDDDSSFGLPPLVLRHGADDSQSSHSEIDDRFFTSDDDRFFTVVDESTDDDTKDGTVDAPYEGPLPKFHPLIHPLVEDIGQLFIATNFSTCAG